MDNSKNVSRGIQWQAINFGLKAVLNVIYISLVTRILGVEVFGEYAILSIILMFSVVFTEAGFGAAIVHFGDRSHNLMSTAILCSTMFSFILIAIVVPLSPLIVELFNNDVNANSIIFIMSTTVFLSITTIYQSYFMLVYDFRSIAIASLVSFVIGNFFLAIPLAIMGFGIWSILIGVACKDILNLIILHFKSDFVITFKLEKDSFIRIIKYSYGLIINRLFKGITTQFDKIFIGTLFSINMLGFYERGLTIMNLPKSFVGSSLDGVLFTLFSNNKDNIAYLRIIYTSSISLISFGMIFIGFLFLFHSDFIVGVLFGDNWQASSDVLKVISIGLFFFPYWRFLDTLVRSTKYFGFAFVIQLLKFVSLLIFAYVGNLYWGFQGLLCGILISELIYTLVSITLSNYILSMSMKSFIVSQKYCFGYFFILFILHLLIRSFSLTVIFNFLFFLIVGLFLTFMIILNKPSFYGKVNIQFLIKLIESKSNIPLLKLLTSRISRNLT